MRPDFLANIPARIFARISVLVSASWNALFQRRTNHDLLVIALHAGPQRMLLDFRWREIDAQRANNDKSNKGKEGGKGSELTYTPRVVPYNSSAVVEFIVVVCMSVCVCVCVCLSVTRRYCIRTAALRITQTTSHDSQGILVCWCHRSLRP